MGVVATILGILINPRWQPFHRNGYNFLPIRHRWFIFASIPMFYCQIMTSPANPIWRPRWLPFRSITRIRFIVILEILLVSIARLFRLLNTLEQLLLRSDGYVIVKFKVKGVQVLSTTPNYIFFINNYS